MEAVLQRIQRNEKISSQLMSNEELRAFAVNWMMAKAFKHFQSSVAE